MYQPVGQWIWDHIRPKASHHSLWYTIIVGNEFCFYAPAHLFLHSYKQYLEFLILHSIHIFQMQNNLRNADILIMPTFTKSTLSADVLNFKHCSQYVSQVIGLVGIKMLMHMCWQKCEDGEPCRVGVAMIDLSTGLYTVGAIMAALLRRQTTNTGQHVQCNLLSTQVSVSECLQVPCVFII